MILKQCGSKWVNPFDSFLIPFRFFARFFHFQSFQRFLFKRERARERLNQGSATLSRPLWSFELGQTRGMTRVSTQVTTRESVVWTLSRLRRAGCVECTVCSLCSQFTWNDSFRPISWPFAAKSEIRTHTNRKKKTEFIWKDRISAVDVRCGLQWIGNRTVNR